MAGKSNALRNEFLRVIFNGEVPAGGVLAELGVVCSPGPYGNLELSLHTSDPGPAGTQATNQCAYTGYAPKGVTRTTGAWTVTANVVSPAVDQDFPKCTAGSESATHVAVTTETGLIVYSGALTPPITIANGVIPRIETGSTITET